VHKLDVGRTRFRQLVANALEAEPALPLVHGSDAFKFLNALEDGDLKPQPCDKGQILFWPFILILPDGAIEILTSLQIKIGENAIINLH